MGIKCEGGKSVVYISSSPPSPPSSPLSNDPHLFQRYSSSNTSTVVKMPSSSRSSKGKGSSSKSKDKGKPCDGDADPPGTYRTWNCHCCSDSSGNMLSSGCAMLVKTNPQRIECGHTMCQYCGSYLWYY